MLRCEVRVILNQMCSYNESLFTTELTVFIKSSMPKFSICRWSSRAYFKKTSSLKHFKLQHSPSSTKPTQWATVCSNNSIIYCLKCLKTKFMLCFFFSFFLRNMIRIFCNCLWVHLGKAVGGTFCHWYSALSSSSCHITVQNTFFLSHTCLFPSIYDTGLWYSCSLD